MSTGCFQIFNSVLSTRYSALLLDQPIRPRQHVRLNYHTNLLPMFNIDSNISIEYR